MKVAAIQMIAGSNVHLLVFENGIYRADLSSTDTIENLVIGPISALKENQTFKNNFLFSRKGFITD